MDAETCKNDNNNDCYEDVEEKSDIQENDQKLHDNNIPMKRCASCKTLHPLSEFNNDKQSKDGKAYSCRKANLAKRVQRDQSMSKRAFFKYLLRSAKHNSKTRKRKQAMGPMSFEVDDAEALDKKQKESCAISGLPMKYLKMSHFQCSFDRIDDDVTYLNGNVQLICLEFQNRAKWTCEDLKEFTRLSTQNLSKEELTIIIASAENKLPKLKRCTSKSIMSKTGIQEYYCFRCNTYQIIEMFPTGRTTECTKCNNNRLRRSVHYEIKALLKDARSHTRSRNKSIKKSGGSQVMTCTITLPYLIKLFKIQSGRCYYSNVPFQYEFMIKPNQIHNKLWNMSLERINPLGNYEPGNVCFIICGLQSQDMTRRAKVSNGGSAGWSRVKVAYLCKWKEEKGLGKERPSVTFEDFCRGYVDSQQLVLPLS